MEKSDIIHLRQMIVGSQIRISHLALSLHNEQERLETIINNMDALIAEELQ